MNRSSRNRFARLRLESLESRLTPAATFFEFIDPNPAADNQFGSSVTPLSTGNVVVTSPFDDAGGNDAGAVYLFSGSTGALLSTLRGSSAGDQIGSAGVVEVGNGNFVVVSPFWNNGSLVDAGAVTFGNGVTGINGTVGASNSLVGSSNNDRVGTLQGGSIGLSVLTNGNYVVTSSRWDNGLVVDAGAVTFGNGLNGVVGVITSTNSLVGSQANDRVGAIKTESSFLGNTFDSLGVTALANGNYAVGSSYWDNSSVTDAGAVTSGQYWSFRMRSSPN